MGESIKSRSGILYLNALNRPKELETQPNVVRNEREASRRRDEGHDVVATATGAALAAAATSATAAPHPVLLTLYFNIRRTTRGCLAAPAVSTMVYTH